MLPGLEFFLHDVALWGVRLVAVVLICIILAGVYELGTRRFRLVDRRIPARPVFREDEAPETD